MKGGNIKEMRLHLEAMPDVVSSEWTEEEVKLLTDFYPTKNTKDIADSLDRTYSSVRSKVTSLGLRKVRK